MIRHDFREKKVIEYKLRVMIFLQLLSETFFILRRIQRGDVINVYSKPSKVEHNSFQEAVRLSICSTFELNLPIRNNVN